MYVQWGNPVARESQFATHSPYVLHRTRERQIAEPLSGEHYDIVPDVVNYKYILLVYIYKITVRVGFRSCFAFTH